jgi:uncharacterized protein
VISLRSAVEHLAVEPERDAARALDLGTVVDGKRRDGVPLRVPLSALAGQVLIIGAVDEVTSVIARLLEQLGAAGVPWLRVGRLAAQVGGNAGSHANGDSVSHAGAGRAAAPATVIDLADPGGVPLTLNPLEPEPGYPATAHASALCALLQAAFDLPDPLRDVLALALHRLYTVGPDPVPTLPWLERAAVEAARELGHNGAMEVALRGFIRVRLGGLVGPATGLFLGGGHPADVAEMISRDVDVVTGDVVGAEGRSLLAGAVALRVAERLCQFPRTVRPGAPRHVLVIEEAGLLFCGSRAAQQIGRLLADATSHGAGVIVTERSPMPIAPWLARGAGLTITHHAGAAVVTGPWLSHPVAVRVPRVPSSPWSRSVTGSLVARRSEGCGWPCRTQRPCTRKEIAASAELADAAESAWLRLWTQTLLLAFLTGRPLPAVPPPLLTAWQRLDPRTRECALATVAERAAATRSAALRGCYPVPVLIGVLTRVAADLLEGRSVPRTAGQVWVVPQLRWAHEAARVGWGGRDRVGPDDVAPPLDFALAGLPDWPGMPAAERLRLLLGHPLSQRAERNRELAATALFGAEGRASFEAALRVDLATVLGGATEGHLSEATRLMDCPREWPVRVLKWLLSR